MIVCWLREPVPGVCRWILPIGDVCQWILVVLGVCRWTLVAIDSGPILIWKGDKECHPRCVSKDVAVLKEGRRNLAMLEDRRVLGKIACAGSNNQLECMLSEIDAPDYGIKLCDMECDVS